ncbi:hypothetical protein Strvi_0129 (plasmid) [Streptomyces violaceusniger Tu 4113]|uniref:Uncharacterized protein n=1 Tax=Streptomyces violaceusniger (strain Tu 4113) TaxID=653045 RepID=G2PHV4_STRV4|nr:hypothetical protein Strvi_0129 [Streptomyces violaceusniger Tu 4113]
MAAARGRLRRKAPRLFPRTNRWMSGVPQRMKEHQDVGPVRDADAHHRQDAARTAAV